MIARRSCLGIERQCKVRDVVDRSVNTRQHRILVVGIGRRGREIPVHALAAAVHIRGRSGYIRIIVICARCIVDACPAGGEGLGIGDGAVVRIVLKAVLIWERADE